MLGLIIAIAAGAASPKIEDLAARPLAKILSPHIEVSDGEIPVLAFMIGMLVAAVLSSIVGNGSAISVLFGGTLGYFGLRLFLLGKRVVQSSTEK